MYVVNNKTKLRKQLLKIISNSLLVGSLVGILGIVTSSAMSTKSLTGSFSFAETAEAAGPVESWWPVDGARITGVQPFKGVVSGRDITSYQMFWEVDGGTWNWMNDSWEGYQHKEVMVDLSGWKWKGAGPYTITFIAREHSGQIIGKTSMAISIGSTEALRQVSIQPIAETTVVPVAPVVSATPVVAPAPVSTISAPIVTVAAGLRGAKLYVADSSPAKTQANQWRTSRPADAAKMDKLGAQATAAWFGNWNGNITEDVKNYVGKADAQGATAVLIAYNIPGRDCGGYSSGGSNSPEGYKSWIRGLAAGIGSKKAAVILEPDAVAGMDCLSSGDQNTRLELIKDAVSVLKANANTAVYVDAGNAHWQSAATMADRLNRGGIAKADGFSLNVSNFYTNAENTTFGRELSGKLGGKHYVVDTSRNGSGSNGEWCNPSGRSVGNAASTNTGDSLIDAYLWAKVPGESDGWCNGGPGAGAWWADYALGLAARAGW